MRRISPVNTVLVLTATLLLAACAGGSQPAPEVPESEITASVPELTAMHDLVYPLWHTAYPEKDYDLIRELLPGFEEHMTAVEQASLPGILREKETAWQEGKELLTDSFTALKEAAKADDRDEMLKQTETFHMNYERLVRVLRPLVGELEEFHQELYKLYHYYMPAYDLAKIREAVSAMEEKVEPLKGVQLPSRLSDRQSDFEEQVAELSRRVAALARQLENPSRNAVNQAIESVHTAYQNTEKIFD